MSSNNNFAAGRYMEVKAKISLTSLIFVTGLAGHAYGSWKTSEQSTMWIQDFLVNKDFGDHVRILLYGYETRLRDSTSVAGIADFAAQFLNLFC